MDGDDQQGADGKDDRRLTLRLDHDEAIGEVVEVGNGDEAITPSTVDGTAGAGPLATVGFTWERPAHRATPASYMASASNALARMSTTRCVHLLKQSDRTRYEDELSTRCRLHG